MPPEPGEAHLPKRSVVNEPRIHYINPVVAYLWGRGTVFVNRQAELAFLDSILERKRPTTAQFALLETLDSDLRRAFLRTPAADARMML
jgi:hypothetical protein